LARHLRQASCLAHPPPSPKKTIMAPIIRKRLGGTHLGGKKRFRLDRYGNYCGPNWSDGKEQVSVCGNNHPIDKLDAACKVHDCAYARGANKKDADFKFAREAIKHGARGILYGSAVGVQGFKRSITDSEPSRTPKKRGGVPPPTPTKVDPLPVRRPDPGTQRTVSRSDQPAISSAETPFSKIVTNHFMAKRSTKRRASSRRGSVKARRNVKKVRKQKKKAKPLRFSRPIPYSRESYIVGGGTNDSKYMVYCGVNNCPVDSVITQLSRTIVQQVAKLAGDNIVDFRTDVTDTAAGAITFFCTWRPSQIDSPINTAISWDTNYNVTATNVATFFRNAFSGQMGNPNKGANSMIELIAFGITSDVGSLATLHCADLKVKFVCKSVMKFQNISTGGYGGDAAVDYAITSIAQNPLVGKLYHIRGNAVQARTDDTYKPICGDHSTGILRGDQANNWTTQLKPPQKTFFHRVKGMHSVKLMPGKIYTWKSTDVIQGNLATIITEHYKYLSAFAAPDGIGGQQKTVPGKGTTMLLALEKELYSGESANINYHIQHDNVVTVSSAYRKRLPVVRFTDQQA